MQETGISPTILRARPGSAELSTDARPHSHFSSRATQTTGLHVTPQETGPHRQRCSRGPARAWSGTSVAALCVPRAAAGTPRPAATSPNAVRTAMSLDPIAIFAHSLFQYRSAQLRTRRPVRTLCSSTIISPRPLEGQAEIDDPPSREAPGDPEGGGRSRPQELLRARIGRASSLRESRQRKHLSGIVIDRVR